MNSAIKQIKYVHNYICNILPYTAHLTLCRSHRRGGRVRPAFQFRSNCWIMTGRRAIARPICCECVQCLFSVRLCASECVCVYRYVHIFVVNFYSLYGCVRFGRILTHARTHMCTTVTCCGLQQSIWLSVPVRARSARVCEFGPCGTGASPKIPAIIASAHVCGVLIHFVCGRAKSFTLAHEAWLTFARGVLANKFALYI